MAQSLSGAGTSWTLDAWERGLREGPIDRAVTLLAASAGLSREEAEQVELGDRDALLAATLGELTGTGVWACADCSGCGERLDVAIDPAALLRPRSGRAEQPLEVEVGGRRIAFRLPCSRDLRGLPADDPVGGRMLLLSRCLSAAAGGLTAEAIAAVEAAMEDASPGAAVTFAIHCPVCRASTRTALDVPALLWARVRSSALALLHEVHVLAGAYGWTEQEVLALSPMRRASYLELAGG